MLSLRHSVTIALACASFSLFACSSSNNSTGGTGGSTSGDACEQACNKLESCSPGTVCSINGPCTGSNLKLAECINQAACDKTSQCIFGNGGSGGTPGTGGSPNLGGAGGSGGAPSFGGSAGSAGSGGIPGVGGSAGTGGTGTGACADIAGVWNVSGTCGVDNCVITQSGCSANFVCDSGSASYSGDVTASSVHFVGADGTCDAVVTGGSLMGSCNGSSGQCLFDATKQ